MLLGWVARIAARAKKKKSLSCSGIFRRCRACATRVLRARTHTHTHTFRRLHSLTSKNFSPCRVAAHTRPRFHSPTSPVCVCVCVCVWSVVCGRQNSEECCEPPSPSPPSPPSPPIPPLRRDRHVDDLAGRIRPFPRARPLVPLVRSEKVSLLTSVLGACACTGVVAVSDTEMALADRRNCRRPRPRHRPQGRAWRHCRRCHPLHRHLCHLPRRCRP